MKRTESRGLSDQSFSLHRIGGRGHRHGNGGSGDGVRGFKGSGGLCSFESNGLDSEPATCVNHVLAGVALTKEGERLLALAETDGGASRSRQALNFNGSHPGAGAGVPPSICDNSGVTPTDCRGMPVKAPYEFGRFPNAGNAKGKSGLVQKISGVIHARSEGVEGARV